MHCSHVDRWVGALIVQANDFGERFTKVTCKAHLPKIMTLAIFWFSDWSSHSEIVLYTGNSVEINSRGGRSQHLSLSKRI